MLKLHFLHSNIRLLAYPSPQALPNHADYFPLTTYWGLPRICRQINFLEKVEKVLSTNTSQPISLQTSELNCIIMFVSGAIGKSSTYFRCYEHKPTERMKESNQRETHQGWFTATEQEASQDQATCAGVGYSSE